VTLLNYIIKTLHYRLSPAAAKLNVAEQLCVYRVYYIGGFSN
jgi:hypothetical protein